MVFPKSCCDPLEVLCEELCLPRRYADQMLDFGLSYGAVMTLRLQELTALTGTFMAPEHRQIFVHHVQLLSVQRDAAKEREGHCPPISPDTTINGLVDDSAPRTDAMRDAMRDASSETTASSPFACFEQMLAAFFQSQPPVVNTALKRLEVRPGTRVRQSRHRCAVNSGSIH
mmetsp:Transcript_49052/g.128048  ORF Transcript_49052/g.128048 Transcript_49052/m.128048 type:complete len:172 (+) Transcript_49052:161-676(+)